MRIKRSLFGWQSTCQWCLIQPAEYELDTAGTQLELFGGNDLTEKICWSCFKQATLAEIGSTIDTYV